MRKVPNLSDKAPEPVNLRDGESPFAPGQKVMLLDFQGQIDRVVTIVEPISNVPQCSVRDQDGKTFTVAEKRLRCE